MCSVPFCLLPKKTGARSALARTGQIFLDINYFLYADISAKVKPELLERHNLKECAVSFIQRLKTFLNDSIDCQIVPEDLM